MKHRCEKAWNSYPERTPCRAWANFYVSQYGNQRNGIRACSGHLGKAIREIAEDTGNSEYHVTYLPFTSEYE